MQAAIQRIRIWLLIMHPLLCIINFTVMSPKFKSLQLKYFTQYIGLVVYIYTILSISTHDYYLPFPAYALNFDTGAITLQLKTEVYVFYMIIIFNILLMSLRKFMKPKIDLTQSIDPSLLMPKIDTLIALNPVSLGLQ